MLPEAEQEAQLFHSLKEVLILLDDITSKSVRADASLPAGAGADEILAHFEQCTHRILRGMRSCAVEKLSSHG
jgi:hypothetical protein